jgi:hypothetical protein
MFLKQIYLVEIFRHIVLLAPSPLHGGACLNENLLPSSLHPTPGTHWTFRSCPLAFTLSSPGFVVHLNSYFIGAHILEVLLYGLVTHKRPIAFVTSFVGGHEWSESSMSEGWLKSKLMDGW